MNAWSGGRGGGAGDVMGPSVTRAGSGAGAGGGSAGARAPPLKNGSDLRAAGYLIAVGSRTARFRRKHKHKMLMVLLLALVFLLLILFIMMTVLYVRARRPPPRPACASRECLRAAANLATSMDPTADPCDDFYQYACGKWAEEHPRPDALRSFDWFRDKQARVYALVRDALARNETARPRPVQQARSLYDACMDTDTLDKRGLQPALAVLAALGLPPLPAYLTDSEDEDFSFDWLEAVIKAKVQLGMDVLVGFDIFTDPRNSSVYRLVMGSPETTNPFPSMHTEKKRHRHRSRRFRDPTQDGAEETFVFRDEPFEARKAAGGEGGEEGEEERALYAELMKIFAVEAGGGEGGGGNRSEGQLDASILQAAAHYYHFNELIYELEADNSTEPDEDLYLDVPEYSADELQALTDAAVLESNGTTAPLWRRYLEGVFSVSATTLEPETDRVLVAPPDRRYLEQLAALLARTPPATIQLYVWVKIVEVLAPHTTTEVRALLARGRQRRGAGEPAAPRALLCASIANDMLGMAVAYAVADPHFLNVTKPKVEDMIQEMKYALAGLVARAHWMDDDTKLATYAKVARMRTLVGFPAWLLQDGALEEYYAGIEVDPHTHLENMMSIVQLKVRRVLDRFREPHNATWATDPTEVNAYHTFQENTITVPMVMLQYPFFDLGLDSLNYGSLGTILGHEITHGFDNFGRLFDQAGNLVPWWSNATVAAFLNVTACFVDQYSAYYVPELDEHVDGKRTLGENIADNGGVREALAALRRRRARAPPEPALPGFERMTPDQLFFLSYGNLWCGVWTRAALAADLRDEHAPQRLRARGVLQNSADFARAFHCKPGSRMNPHPHKRCIVF